MSNLDFEGEAQAYYQAAKSLLDKAETEGRDSLSALDQNMFDKLMALGNESKAKGDRRAAVKPGVTERGSLEGETPSKGTILTRDQSYADYLIRTGRARNEDREVTLGGFVRGMAGLSCSPAEKRAIGEGTISGGGAIVPVYLAGLWFDALRAQAVAYKAGAAVLDMPTSQVNIARLVSDPTVGWYAENTQLTESDPSFAQVSLNAKTLGVLTTSSIQLMEDAPNFGTVMTNSLTKALALGLDQAVFVGTGTGNQPTGIKNVAGINTFSMGTNGAALVNYDPILEAINLMQTSNVYSDPTAAVMAPRSAKEFYESKTSTNQYLARPDSIAKLPFLITTSIPGRVPRLL